MAKMKLTVIVEVNGPFDADRATTIGDEMISAFAQTQFAMREVLNMKLDAVQEDVPKKPAYRKIK